MININVKIRIRNYNRKNCIPLLFFSLLFTSFFVNSIRLKLLCIIDKIIFILSPILVHFIASFLSGFFQSDYGCQYQTHQTQHNGFST